MSNTVPAPRSRSLWQRYATFVHNNSTFVRCTLVLLWGLEVVFSFVTTDLFCSFVTTDFFLKRLLEGFLANAAYYMPSRFDGSTEELSEVLLSFTTFSKASILPSPLPPHVSSVIRRRSSLGSSTRPSCRALGLGPPRRGRRRGAGVLSQGSA